MKLNKRRKSSRMHGRGAGSHGWGSRKKHKKSGHRGGKGMAGTGKRADQKKSLIIKLYGNEYFGKQGITSRGTAKDKSKFINLRDIEKNIEKYKDKNNEINLKDYKVLGDGEITKAVTIKARGFTKSAKDKIEKAGGKIILTRIYKEVEKKVVEVKENKK